MLSTPIMLESLDSPLLLETAKFAIHAVYTKFNRCTWLLHGYIIFESDTLFYKKLI